MNTESPTEILHETSHEYATTEILHETSHEYANKFSQLSNVTTTCQF
jgi:hypothetical protein